MSSLRLSLRLRVSALKGLHPASISSATRFLISCRASHKYLNASFLNTCFFSVSDTIPKSSSFLASSSSLLKSPMSNSSIPDTSIDTSSCRASAIARSTCFIASFTMSPYPRNTSCVTLKSLCLLSPLIRRLPPLGFSAWFIR